MALSVGVPACPRIEEMQRGVAEFRRAWIAEADTDAAEEETQPARGADVGIEFVAAGLGDHPRFLRVVGVLEIFETLGQPFRFGGLERLSGGLGGVAAEP